MSLGVRFLRPTTSEFSMLHSTKSYPWITTSMRSINPFTITSAHYDISVPTHLRKWHLTALALTMQILFSMAQLRKKTSQTTESTIQNLLGRVVTNSIQSSSHTLLQQLHWLPAEYGIDSKISNVTFRTLHSSQPTYLFSALHAHRSTRSFRLSYTKLLTVSFVQTSLNAHSFGFAGSKIWNSLPPAF